MKKEYLIFGSIVIVLLIVLIGFQINNNKKQAEIQAELQRVQEEKEFCDNLEISIGSGWDAVASGYGIAARRYHSLGELIIPDNDTTLG